MSLFGFDLASILIRLPVLLLALTVHEVAHGYAAMKLGDPTARNLGRLTLNPLKHLDPMGALCMLLFRFGWAKPVPINARYFRNPRRDMALTALAGPASNFLMAFAGALLYHGSIALFNALPEAAGYIFNVQMMAIKLFAEMIVLNVSFGVFNLIPVPPLDGSRAFLIFLPPKYYFGIMKYERYIMLGLMALLWVGALDGILSFIVSGIVNGMLYLVGLIPFL